MKADYLATMSLWRSPETMRQFIKWLIVGQFMIAAGLTVIWINRCAENTMTATSAIRFGFFVGMIATAYAPIFYAVMPLPGMICFKWVIFGILQSILVTLVLYVTTRKLAQAG